MFLEVVGYLFACVVGLIICAMLEPWFKNPNKIISLIVGICAAAFVAIGVIIGIIGAFTP